MEYIIDHDLHIHSNLSLCSSDPEQNKEEILRYAKENGLKSVCVTDHFWDEAVEKGVSTKEYFYEKEKYSYITKIKPLPQMKGTRFLFGCETDMNRYGTLGLSKEKYDAFDFIIIPTTHFHFVGATISPEEASGAESRAQAWVRRLDAVLNMDLPFHKVGIAHLSCVLLAPTREEYLETLEGIPENEMRRLFLKAAKLGVGIEINAFDMNFEEQESETVLRIYRIAKDCGCKFYLGSDAHHPKELECSKQVFSRAIAMLGLTEDDKFTIK